MKEKQQGSNKNRELERERHEIYSIVEGMSKGDRDFERKISQADMAQRFIVKKSPEGIKQTDYDETLTDYW